MTGHAGEADEEARYKKLSMLLRDRIQKMLNELRKGVLEPLGVQDCFGFHTHSIKFFLQPGSCSFNFFGVREWLEDAS